MTTSAVVFSDATVTITKVTNGDVVPAGTPGYWESLQSVYVAGTGPANLAAIQTNVANNLTTLLNWIAANPNGAVLTAAQTLVLAKMIVGLSRLALAQTTATTGT